jgi:hypothetical protein
MRTDDKALVVIAVNDLEERGLFHYPDWFTFQVFANHGESLDEGYLECSGPNAGILTLVFRELDSTETIDLTLSNFNISGFEESYFSYLLSDGVWSFSFTAEHQEVKTIKCSVGVVSADVIYDEMGFNIEKTRFSAFVTEVTVAPFYVSLITSANLWTCSDIYLLMDDDSVIWLMWDTAQGTRSLSGYTQEDGTVLTGFDGGDVWLVDAGMEGSGGYFIPRSDGQYEHISLISSTKESRMVSDSVYVSLDALIDISHVAAIVINGEQIYFQPTALREDLGTRINPVADTQ